MNKIRNEEETTTELAPEELREYEDTLKMMRAAGFSRRNMKI